MKYLRNKAEGKFSLQHQTELVEIEGGKIGEVPDQLFAKIHFTGNPFIEEATQEQYEAQNNLADTGSSDQNADASGEVETGEEGYPALNAVQDYIEAGGDPSNIQVVHTGEPDKYPAEGVFGTPEEEEEIVDEAELARLDLERRQEDALRDMTDSEEMKQLYKVFEGQKSVSYPEIFKAVADMRQIAPEELQALVDAKVEEHAKQIAELDAQAKNREEEDMADKVQINDTCQKAEPSADKKPVMEAINDTPEPKNKKGKKLDEKSK